jgi:mannose-6-phosphate isomerase-like protein (cupin superfamily)
MIVRDLGPDIIGALKRVDLATLSEAPPDPADSFEFNGCTCGLAAFVGSPPWEFHGDGDELIHVLSGQTRLTVREAGEDRVRTLGAGDLAVVPKGCWHRNDAPDGVTLFHMTPSQGNRHSWDDPAA